MWLKSIPETPGRYWWRIPGLAAVGPSYGLLLVKWSRPWIGEAALRVVSSIPFECGDMGERSGDSGWSYSGSTHSPTDFCRFNPGVEVWSEPELGPEGFLPLLPGKPEPRDPGPGGGTKKSPTKAELKRTRDEMAAAEKAERVKKIAEAAERGVEVYECDSCGELRNADELVTVRECPHCGESFDGSDGRHCPSCNRPFTSKVTEVGCADCLAECSPVTE